MATITAIPRLSMTALWFAASSLTAFRLPVSARVPAPPAREADADAPLRVGPPSPRGLVHLLVNASSLFPHKVAARPHGPASAARYAW